MENYEKKYKEALERVRLLKLANPDDEAIQTFVKDSFPELKEKESEDERIRKDLVSFLWAVANGTVKSMPAAIMCQEWIAYLEKQKINTEGDFGRGYDCGYQAGYASKEQKLRNNSTREKIISRATSEKQVVLISASNGKAEIGWDTRSLEDTKKLLEYGLAFINKNSINSAEKQKAVENPKKGCPTYPLSVAEGLLLAKTPPAPIRFEQKQKPAEWSEEDKRKLNRIYEILGHAADDKGFLTSKRIIGDNEAIELQDFLKSLCPQSKVEWSEKDESYLQTVITEMEANKKEAREYEHKTYDSIISWLKSLKDRGNFPKSNTNSPSEWSEEDEHRCKDAIYFLETAKKHYASTSEIELTIEWLKSLQLQAKQAQPEQKPEAKLTGWAMRGINEEVWVRLDRKSFPDLKDEPMEVEITIKKKNAEL